MGNYAEALAAMQKAVDLTGGSAESVGALACPRTERCKAAGCYIPRRTPAMAAGALGHFPQRSWHLPPYDGCKELRDDVNIKGYDGQFQAANATTGEILYSFNTGTMARSGPITFLLDGKQYVVQAVGGVPIFGNDQHHLEHGGAVVAFSR